MIPINADGKNVT